MIKLKSKETISSLLFLLLLILVTYLNVFNADFVSDDIIGIRDNSYMGDINAVFKRPLYFLRPLLLYISNSLGGLIPFYYRIFNLIFHTGTVLVVYLLSAILYDKRYALFVAAIFAVHPILVESVAWISGVTYPQYSFFLLISLLMYIIAKQKKKLIFYYLSLGFFLISLLSSEKSVVFPLILLVFELSFDSIKANWKRVIPYVVVAAIIGGLFALNIGQRATSFEAQYYEEINVLNPFKQIPLVVSTYLQLIFWPSRLTTYQLEGSPILFNEFLIHWIVFLGFLLSVLISYRKNKFVFFWLCFFLLTIMPTLIPLAITQIIAERYVYLGTVGVVAALVYILFKLAIKRHLLLMLYAILTVCIVLLMARSIIRNRDWMDEYHLRLATLKTSPLSARAHNNMGMIYGNSGDYQSAVKEFKRAIALKPHYSNPYHNIATIYAKFGKYDTAMRFYQYSLKINPKFWKSHRDLGIIYYLHKNYAEAEKEIKNALLTNPKNPALIDMLSKMRKREQL